MSVDKQDRPKAAAKIGLFSHENAVMQYRSQNFAKMRYTKFPYYKKGNYM